MLDALCAAVHVRGDVGCILGSVLEAGVVYLHKRDAKTMDEMHKIKSALLQHR